MNLSRRVGALESKTPASVSVAETSARIEGMRAADEASGIVWPEPDEESHRMIEGLRAFLRNQHERT